MPNKGQKFPQKSISKLRASLQKYNAAKYNWDTIEPYLDIRFDNRQKKQVKNVITLREFKKFIQDGNSLRDIKGKGICKHLINFFSNFSQGKVNLPKDIFLAEYEEGKSLDEIAEKYNILRGDIAFLRHLYGIKRKGATYIRRKNTETLLTKEQKEILYGSMMGDASKMSPSSVKFKQGETQKDYLLWKYRKFENIASQNSLKPQCLIDHRSGMEQISWLFYTHANTDVEFCVSEFYPTGNKEINQSILDKLTPLSIAVWFMDDGQTDWGHRSRVKYDQYSTPVCKFMTQSFSYENCLLIQKWFLEKYNISTRLQEVSLSNSAGYKVVISNKSVLAFLDLIEPHILPMFKYKTHYTAYLEKRKESEVGVIVGENVKCPIGADFSALPHDEQDTHINRIVHTLHQKGIEWLIEKPEDHVNAMEKVFTYDANFLLRKDYISFSNIGNKFVMFHFPNFWSARMKGGQSPKNIFNNKQYLSEIIRNIILQGYFPSNQKILTKLKKYRSNRSISGFMPCVAKAIYEKYCPENGKVLDFCSGYGGRLFGAFANDKVLSYTGIEANFKSYYNTGELYRNLLKFSKKKKQVVLINQDSITGMKQFNDNSFDFCFTSPPYFDTEEYSDEESQSRLQYISYGKWFNEYLIKSIEEARRISKKVIINIANTGPYMIADDLEKWLKNSSINYGKDQLRLPHYGKNFRFEPLFIF